MYVQHWGLERPPFSTATAEPVFYLGLPQQEALARLRFLAHNHRRLGLVAGEAGSGKSMLLECYAQQCREQGWAVCLMNLVGLSAREFHWQLALSLRTAPKFGDDSPLLQRRWEDQLRLNQLLDQPTVLLLDDADQAGADASNQLLRLLQLPAAATGKLTVVLTTRESQLSRIGTRLLDQVDLRVGLPPWDADDTTACLELSLAEAGAQHPLFDRQALAELQRVTGGVPRRVVRLAEHALLLGAQAGVDSVTDRTIGEANAALTPFPHQGDGNLPVADAPGSQNTPITNVPGSL